MYGSSWETWSNRKPVLVYSVGIACACYFTELPSFTSVLNVAASILGPLLFTIFINDLPTQLANICKLFADDTKIIGTPGLSLQNDINAAAAWSETWQMKFNANKCKTLHFGIKNTKHKYYLENVLIDNPPFEKDL